jgi:hypothetical protein
MTTYVTKQTKDYRPHNNVDQISKGGLHMDVAALSVAMNQADLMSAVSTEVLSKSLDTFEDMGESQVKMLEKSVQPQLGQNIDMYV